MSVAFGLSDHRDGPLAGVRIVDLSHMLAGPYATMLLADLGAEVIKVEPLSGDFIRRAGPFFDVDGEAFGGYFHSVNRNKKSIALDLTSDEGRQVLHDLVASADALVENFRSGVPEKLMINYESLRAVNPRLVYACIRGFGDPRTGESPYNDWPAYDIIAQAMGGFMSITGYEGGEPLKSGPGIGDLFPAMLMNIGLLAAIHHAQRTGEGQFVDVGMYDAVLSMCERIVYQFSIGGDVPQRSGNAHPIFAPFGVHQTRDGWVTIAAPADKDWRILSHAMGRPELADDPMFATSAARVSNRASVSQLISDWTAERSNAEVVAALAPNVPVGPVQSIDQIFNDAHAKARRMLVDVDHPGTDKTVTIAGSPIKLSLTPAGVRSRAPLLGEHSVDVLTDLGYSTQRVQDLLARGVVKEDGMQVTGGELVHDPSV